MKGDGDDDSASINAGEERKVPADSCCGERREEAEAEDESQQQHAKHDLDDTNIVNIVEQSQQSAERTDDDDDDESQLKNMIDIAQPTLAGAFRIGGNGQADDDDDDDDDDVISDKVAGYATADGVLLHAHLVEQADHNLGDDELWHSNNESNVMQQAKYDIEEVVMDEEAAGRNGSYTAQNHVDMDGPSSLEFVEAEPFEIEQPTMKLLMKNRRIQIYILILVVTTISVTVAIVVWILSAAHSSGDDSNDEDSSNDFQFVTKERFVQHVLPSYTRQALDDPMSDQSLALEWLYSDANSRNMAPFRRLQRYAMAVVFFASTKMRTPVEYFSTGWLRIDHECSWPQVSPPSIVCQNERLLAINQEGNFNIAGTLAPEIGLLTDLAAFNMGGTSIQGTLPTEIGLLSSSLEDLSLPSTQLSGSIPTEFGYLLELTEMNLSNTRLSGNIPSQIGALYNRLDGIQLQACQLTGTLPTEIGLLRRLFGIQINNNDGLGGTIPSEVGNLSNLFALIAHDTSLSGTLPTELGRLTFRLESLTLHSTELSGTIPTELLQCQELETLTLHDTRIDGDFSTVLCGLDNLSTKTVPCENSEAECLCDCQCVAGDSFETGENRWLQWHST